MKQEEREEEEERGGGGSGGELAGEEGEWRCRRGRRTEQMRDAGAGACWLPGLRCYTYTPYNTRYTRSNYLLESSVGSPEEDRL